MSSNSWTVSKVRSRLNSSQCSRTELRSPWRKHIYRISYRCFMDSFWPFGTVSCCFFKPSHSLHWGTPPNSAARLDTLFWSELWFIDILLWSELWFVDVLFWSELWFVDVLFWSKLWFIDVLFWSKLWFMDICSCRSCGLWIFCCGQSCGLWIFCSGQSCVIGTLLA